MSEQSGVDDQHPEDQLPEGGVDIRNNRESVAGARDSSQAIARASDGGAPPREAMAAGTQPDADPDGTAGGDPLAGLTMSEEDRAEAVDPDDGPDELGQKGPGPEPGGNANPHA